MYLELSTWICGPDITMVFSEPRKSFECGNMAMTCGKNLKKGEAKDLERADRDFI